MLSDQSKNWTRGREGEGGQVKEQHNHNFKEKKARKEKATAMVIQPTG